MAREDADERRLREEALRGETDITVTPDEPSEAELRAAARANERSIQEGRVDPDAARAVNERIYGALDKRAIDHPAVPPLVADRPPDPGDPGPPLAAKGTRENPYSRADLKADAQKVAGVLSPATGALLEHLKESEQGLPTEADSTAIPQGVENQKAQLEATIEQLGGGGGPDLKSEQSVGSAHQVEQKKLPPEWYKSLAEYTGLSRNAATGLTEEQTLLTAAQAAAAERKRQMDEDFRIASEDAAAKEASVLGHARDRVQNAVRAYKESGPRAETLGTVLAEAPTGKAAMGILGLIVGGIGAAALGKQSNGFTDAVERNIERRARIAEEESKRLGQNVSMEGDQYRRVLGAVGDAQATREFIRSMYYTELKDELTAAAGKIGIASHDARLQQALSQIELKRMDALEKTAAVVMNRSESQMRQSVGPGTGGKISPQMQEKLGKLEEQRQKLKIPEQEAAIRMIKNGQAQMAEERKQGKHGALSRKALQAVIANPGDWKNTLGVISSQLTPGEIMVLNGVAAHALAMGGKNLTVTEGNRVGTIFGDASPEDILEGIRALQTNQNALEQELIGAGYGDAMQLFRALQARENLEPRKLYDVQGLEAGSSVTERPPVQKAPSGRASP